jgi:uncharacterized protein YndB with AHSA1/START domain
MTERTATHATFSIERVYDAKPARVFAAFANTKEKEAWFHGPEEWGPNVHEMDFRVGGREINRGGPPGEMHAFDALYWDIVPNERIVYSYDMHLKDKRISVSLTTIELKPHGTGTRLVFTEQGVYLDGWDNPAMREEGTKGLLDALGAYVSKAA